MRTMNIRFILNIDIWVFIIILLGLFGEFLKSLRSLLRFKNRETLLSEVVKIITQIELSVSVFILKLIAEILYFIEKELIKVKRSFKKLIQSIEK